MRKIALKLLPLILLGVGILNYSLAHSHNGQSGAIDIITPYAFATTSAQKNGAVFMTIRNYHPEQNITLLEAKSDVAQSTEFHEMSMDGDKMQMRKIGKVEIKAEGKVQLEPHGLHIMLMGLKEPLTEGKTFQLLLLFNDSTIRKAEVVIVKPGTKPSSDEDDSHSKEHADDHDDHSHH